uniref:Regulator of Vps4 activity in the MVB pathway protein n=1 Tax=Leersia perrieri TaxID=77586 RepID=A0A0D9WTF1_9ORYZ
MFDSLLNTKFYNKCKHAFKCIRMRLVPIRRKKEAVIRFMKKDIAELLTNGLDTHAFGRMDGLIVEMNHASCYDMIEQFCEYIGKQLNSLQKQRDCPQETREAVSTLIFAAARFPDLPELCDLRHIFTERYGNFVEPFVSSEFVQKLENKSFTNEEKLQAMQGISEEFLVDFDTKAFKVKLWATPETKHDLMEKESSEKQEEMAMPLSSKQKGNGYAPSGRKSEAATPLGHKKKLEVPLKQQKDVHPAADRLHENTRRQHVDKADDKGHVEKPVQKEVQKANKKDSRPCEKELLEAVELDLNGLPKKGFGSLKVPEIECKKIVPLNVMPKKDNDVEKENSRDLDHHHRSHRRGPADSDLKALGLDNQGHESVNPLNGNTKTRMPPYSKLDGAKGKNCAEKEDSRQQVSERAAYIRPPYIKPKLNMQTVNDDPAERAASDYSKRDIQADHPSDKDAPQPVSVRRKYAKPPATVAVYDEAPVNEKVSSQTPNSHRRHTSRQNTVDDGSARRDGARQPHGGYGMGDVTRENVQRTPSSRSRHSRRRNGALYTDDYDGFKQHHQAKEDEPAIDFGNLLPRSGNGHRSHKSRNADTRSGDVDEEERMMDKLLRHYSKKGLDTEIHTTPTSKTDDVNGAQAQSQQKSAMHPPGRAISLPGESVRHGEDSKVPPARSISLQPDCPRSAHVHPKMPDFDELAARVSALRKG